MSHRLVPGLPDHAEDDHTIRLTGTVVWKRQSEAVRSLLEVHRLSAAQHGCAYDANPDEWYCDDAITPVEDVNEHRLAALSGDTPRPRRDRTSARVVDRGAVSLQPLSDSAKALSSLGLNGAVRARPDVE